MRASNNSNAVGPFPCLSICSHVITMEGSSFCQHLRITTHLISLPHFQPGKSQVAVSWRRRSVELLPKITTQSINVSIKVLLVQPSPPNVAWSYQCKLSLNHTSKSFNITYLSNIFLHRVIMSLLIFFLRTVFDVITFFVGRIPRRKKGVEPTT